LQKWLINRASVIVGTTPVYIKESPYLQSVQDKCTYLPIGIDEMEWDANAVEQIRSQYPGKKIIFSLGRLVGYKGYEYLIDAAKNLSDDYIILIGGSGPLKDTLQAQIDTNNLQSKVKLLGRVSDENLPNYYKAIDLYCLSSTMKTEAFAIVQLEAMAARKPVVSARIPGSGVAWVNVDQESGITVETHSAKALSDAFRKILEDKALYDRLAQGARNRYETVFRKEKMIEKCLDIYRSLNG
jgi:rhamnosyl/mannosyltransferase